MVNVEKIQKKKRKRVSIQLVAAHILLVVFLALLLLPEDTFRKPTIEGDVLAQARIIGSFAPVFDHPLRNFTINQTDDFFYDINCSDSDLLDFPSYFDNFTGFQIDNLTGNISAVGGFNQTLVGNNTIEISCVDTFGNTTTGIFVLEILDVFGAPVLDPIGNQIAVESQLFLLDVDATDEENDPLTFADNTTLFDIDPVTGLINFTPLLAEIGNYTVNISVTDGELFDWEVVLFTVVRGPFCGDDSCGNGESCSSCEADCGACPIQPPDDSGASGSAGGGGVSGGGGGGGGAIAEELSSPPPFQRCDEKWECSEWGICTIEGLRSRSCKDINRCETDERKPPEVEDCVYQPTCFDGFQNGGETGIDCGGPCPACPVETCFDGIQNNGEEGVDCGGPCEKLCDFIPARIPIIEIPGLLSVPRAFPWIVPLIIAIMLLLFLVGDRAYLKYLEKKNKLEAYLEKRREYEPFRRFMLKAMLNMAAITVFVSGYIFFFSNNPEGMKKNVWILALLLAATPAMVSFGLRKFRYYEYIKERKERHFRQLHRFELVSLIKIEDDLLREFETKTNKEILRDVKDHEFDGYPVIYNFVRGYYSTISQLIKKRLEKKSYEGLGAEELGKLAAVLEKPALKKFAKTYPEFDLMLHLLDYLKEHAGEDTTDKENELATQIEELSKPHLKTVIEAQKGLIPVYNLLVDIYQDLTKKQMDVVSLDKEIFALERAFTDRVKELAKKSEAVTKISKNKKLASVYNNVITLFNHYTKKQQLKKALENA